MELEFLRWIADRFPSPESPLVRVGIGDDAAVLAGDERHDLVITTDMFLDGAHFDLCQTEPQLVGRKALAANLSDLAAMAAEPLAAFVSVGLPSDNAASLARLLYEGMAPLAERYRCPVLGGDTNCWSGRLVINVCLVGRCPAGRAWLRSGARPGDEIVVSGPLGGSILGKHFQFEPRVSLALYLRDRYQVHACCDISDGLALDLWRICQASRCGAVVEAERIPIADAAYRQSAHSGRTPREHALSDGEDFELLLAVSPDEQKRMLADPQLQGQIFPIGRFCSERGLWMEEQGSRTVLQPVGYEHGRS
ncbi:MAG: thiamine-monophosphate kinase [Pirellulaceae bacterium]|nr:MAG: thiamine-monophosphate kinase [Pirellulaceae bacterium]